MPDSKAKIMWNKYNTVQISIKLNKRTDSDIIDAISGKPKQTEIKRLMRIGMEYDFEKELKKSEIMIDVDDTQLDMFGGKL